jgi:putative restriction endonuclease
MCGKLDFYLKAFARLRTDSNKNSWTSLTYNRSPYKPFLLLSILDFIESGKITGNFIEPSFDLAQAFQDYCALLPPTGRQASMAYPFYHLESSGFWLLKPRQGEEHKPGGAIQSVKRLREVYFGAQFSADLFPLLQMPMSRDKLRTVLSNTYFVPELQQAVLRQSLLNCQSEKYSNVLLTTAEQIPAFPAADISSPQMEKVRDQGFRKAVVQLYDHRCALCGIKMLTPEGYTVVDAAHIKPWSVSHNDHPTNGMALCKLCHWSYDEGLMSVNPDYFVMISPAVRNEPNLPGHMLTLSDRQMFRPSENRFWPDQDSFEWHRKERFKSR